MASAEEYAAWIIKNQNKKGTPEFETVANAYQSAKNELISQPETKARSFTQQISRVLGLTGRAAITGVSGLPAIAADALIAPYQAIQGGVRIGDTQIIPPLAPSFPSVQQPSVALQNAMTIAGVPFPETDAERLVQSVGSSIAGAGAGISAGGLLSNHASPIVQRIGEQLRVGPGIQAASAAIGGGAAGLAAEEGAGILGQTAAGLAGGIIPSIPGIAAGGIRSAFAGNAANREAGLRRIQEFSSSNTSPSVAQAFQRPAAQASEAFLSRDPGAHHVMIKFAEKQAEQMGEKVSETANILAGKTSPMIAGRAIEQGITGEGGFLDKFKATSRTLYDNLDTYIPGEKEVKVGNTQKTLNRLTSPNVGAKETTKLLVNAKVLQINQALESDLKGKPPTKTINILGADGNPISTVNIGGSPSKNTIPYSALKELRSKVGELLADSSLIADIPRRQLKQLYAGLSEDMRQAVTETGDHNAVNVFNRANRYTKAGHDRIDQVLQPIIDRGAPEKIFQAALSGTREGDTIIHGIMQSLPESSQRVLASTILKKLGMATPGKQGAEGDTFSVSTYLTNWNKLSPESKRSIFSRYGTDFVNQLNIIARTTENIRQGGQVFANPSGTAPALTLQHTVGGVVLLTLTGNIGAAGAIVGEEVLANQMAQRMMTNPRFVKWLAKAQGVPSAFAPAMLNQLEQEGRKSNDSDVSAFAKAMKESF